MSTPAVTRQDTADPNTRMFHTRFELVETPEIATKGAPNEGVSSFGMMFFDIRGIVNVRVAPYLLLITKAPLFTWEEITPRVEEILTIFDKSQRQLDDEAQSVDRVSGHVPVVA